MASSNKIGFSKSAVHSPNGEAGERSFSELGTRFYGARNYGLKRVPPPYTSDGQDPGPVLEELRDEKRFDDQRRVLQNTLLGEFFPARSRSSNRYSFEDMGDEELNDAKRQALFMALFHKKLGSLTTSHNNAQEVVKRGAQRFDQSEA